MVARRVAGGIAFALALMAPVVTEAQTRPSNSMHTNSAELYFDRAQRTNREDEKKGLLEKALGFALDGIKNKAENPKAYLLAGKIYVQLGDAAAADSMFDKAQQLWPDYGKEIDPERLQMWVRAYNAGIVAMRANDLAEAVKQFEGATQVFDKRPGAHLNLGQIYSRQNQPDKAIAAYREAIAIMAKPENRQGLKPEEVAQYKEFEETATFNLGQLLATAGKNEEALTAYQEFLSRNPDNSVAKSNVAVVLARLGKNDDAARIYNELLALELSADEAFRIGVGLFRSNQHSQASAAFRKAIAKNPQMRDAYYNLAQSLYSAAAEVEAQKLDATAAAAQPGAAQLVGLFTELAQVTEKLNAIDPANRNVIALQSRAYRGLADLATDPKVVTQWKNKTLEALKANEALTFTVEDVVMTNAGGQVQISGNVVNQKGTAGQPARLRIHLLDSAGTSIDTQEVTVSLPETQGASPLKVTASPAGVPAGWKYEILP